MTVELPRVRNSTDEIGPPEWTEGITALWSMPAPNGLTKRRWDQLVDDAMVTTDRWGAKAHVLGWSTNAVFGMHPETLDARLDFLGLVPLLRGWRVVEMTPDNAILRTPSGNRLKYRRRTLGGAIVPIWKLPA